MEERRRRMSSIGRQRTEILNHEAHQSTRKKTTDCTDGHNQAAGRPLGRLPQAARRVRRTGVSESNEEKSQCLHARCPGWRSFCRSTYKQACRWPFKNSPPFASRMTSIGLIQSDLRSAVALVKKLRVDTCCVAV